MRKAYLNLSGSYHRAEETVKQSLASRAIARECVTIMITGMTTSMKPDGRYP
jgi:hypothetical protein